MQAFSSDLTLRICSKPHTSCFCHYVIIAFVVDDAVAVGVPRMHCICSSFHPLIHEASSSRASFTTRLIAIHLSRGIAPIKPFLTVHFPGWWRASLQPAWTQALITLDSWCLCTCPSLPLPWDSLQLWFFPQWWAHSLCSIHVCRQNERINEWATECYVFLKILEPEELPEIISLHSF